MDALHNNRIMPVFGNLVFDIGNRPPLGLIHLGQKAHIGTLQMRKRLAQSAPGQDMAVAEDIHRINQHHIQVPFQLPVLVAIIQNCHLGTEMLHRILAGLSTLRSDEHRHARQMLCQHECLITGSSRIHLQLAAVRNHADFPLPLGPVAPVQDNHLVTQIPDSFRQPLGCRRLAGAAYGNIAQADNVAVQLLLAKDAAVIPCQLQIQQHAVDIGKHLQKHHKAPDAEALGLLAVNQLEEIRLEVLQLVCGLDFILGLAPVQKLV